MRTKKKFLSVWGNADSKVTRKNYTHTFSPEMRAQERERLKKLDQFVVPLEY